MSNLELISIIVGVTSSIIGVVVSSVALYISSKGYWRKNLINKTILTAWNFINIYQYLTKFKPNIYEKKWKNSNYIFWSLYQQEIFQDSIIHIFPNIKNINYFQSLNFDDEKIFFEILNKSLFKLNDSLNNAKLSQIKITLKFWTYLFNKINHIQKWLINDLQILYLKKDKNKNYLDFYEKNKYQEFKIEFLLELNETTKLIQKIKNKIKISYILNKKIKIEKEYNEQIKNYRKIKIVLNKIEPKLKLSILKSNIYLLNYVDENGNNIIKIYNKNKLIEQKQI